MILLGIFTMILSMASESGIYGYQFNTLEGKPQSMETFKGKKILIFNSASMCGYTKQLDDFEALNKKYGDKLVIIGFPSNDFMQEKKTTEDIGAVCYGKYNVTFTMAERVKVKGTSAHPIFRWLVSQPNPDFSGEIKWNFEKFLINEDGKLIRRWKSGISPLAEEVVSAL